MDLYVILKTLFLLCAVSQFSQTFLLVLCGQMIELEFAIRTLRRYFQTLILHISYTSLQVVQTLMETTA